MQKAPNSLVNEKVLLMDAITLCLNRCPLNHEIMGQFTYSEEMTKAYVSFPAHKFPYTSSVYYQCHVRLCNKLLGDCEVNFHLLFTAEK